MTKDEALNLALEALETLMIERGAIYDKATTAIREALTQQEQHQDWCASLTQMLMSMPPKPAPCNCKPKPKPKPKPEQEPMACDGDFPEGFDASLGVPAQALRVANAIMCDVIGKREWDVPCTAQHVLSFAKKYTTPPQSKPLTDEEIILIVAECAASHQHTDIHFARAIERAHGIKELV